MTTTTIPQPYYGPGGETFAVEIITAGQKITVPFWTEAEAWQTRDDALDAGLKKVRVLGAPCRAVAFCPKLPPLDITD